MKHFYLGLATGIIVGTLYGAALQKSIPLKLPYS